jgi:hypothetical protein
VARWRRDFVLDSVLVCVCWICVCSASGRFGSRARNAFRGRLPIEDRLGWWWWWLNSATGRKYDVGPVCIIPYICLVLRDRPVRTGHQELVWNGVWALGLVAPCQGTALA